jgi:hypothetical protein
MKTYEATIKYRVQLGEIEWNNLYLDHMGITGLNEQLSREDIVQRLKKGMTEEFTTEIVYGAVCEAQTGELGGTLFFGYRTKDDGSYEIVVDGEPWWRHPSVSNDKLKLLGTPDWWKEHDIESESDVVIGRVEFGAHEIGWDYEGTDSE